MGLLGGLARTAAAAGTWTAVSNRVSRRQANRWAQQDQQDQQDYYQQTSQAAPAAPTAPAPDPIQRLKDLADLKAKGILTEEEFATQKARILAA